MNKTSQELKDIGEGLGFSEPTILEDIKENLEKIENELLLINEKAEGWKFKSIEGLLFAVFIVLIYIAIKLH